MGEVRGLSLRELAELLACELRGDPDARIHGVAPLQSAGAGQISFLANPRYRSFLDATGAGAVILRPADAEGYPGNVLLAKDPYLAYARVAEALHPPPPAAAGIHPTAVVDPDAEVDATAAIGPHCVVEAGVRLAAGVVVGAGCFIGRDTDLGAGTRLMPNVTIYHETRIGSRVLIHAGAVIGGDGFGFANEHGRWVKIPQLGRVIIGDDVEVGANTTIDRGALEDTIIEEGVKLDNLIMVAHNVQIGAHTAAAGCVGIAGSARIGRHCTLAGGVGIVGHLEIADNVHVTGMSMVTHSLAEPGVYSSGTPLMDNRDWRKSSVRFKQLDDMARRLRELEKRLERLNTNEG
ncbi:MAG: UDP-3-O-(3-hydroxymyristoyl)glucosamine N-acyltransferase [Gammaproteobacteria bacterium]|nr:UDP-3-O-(3-hydroxymyristoyl)glucosamine N-acyltransferase [Gammaproteobacteria bacterium]